MWSQKNFPGLRPRTPISPSPPLRGGWRRRWVQAFHCSCCRCCRHIITFYKKPPYGKSAEKGPLFREFWARSTNVSSTYSSPQHVIAHDSEHSMSFNAVCKIAFSAERFPSRRLPSLRCFCGGWVQLWVPDSWVKEKNKQF